MQVVITGGAVMLGKKLAKTGDFHAGAAVRKAHRKIRERIAFMARDRAMDGDVRTITAMIAERAL